jgi:nucleoside-diphosphate-sugar epimerase
MKILIIGATGKLARPVVDHLFRAGLELRLFSWSDQSSLFDGKHETMKGNLFTSSDLKRR